MTDKTREKFLNSGMSLMLKSVSDLSKQTCHQESISVSRCKQRDNHRPPRELRLSLSSRQHGTPTRIIQTIGQEHPTTLIIYPNMLLNPN
jgi:hypothetical protein